jgi:hypothetical protein
MTFRMIAENLTLRVLGRIAGTSNRKARTRPVEVVEGPVHGLLGVVHSGNWGRGFRCRGKDGGSESAVRTFTSWARIVRPVTHIAKLIPHTTEGILIECRYRKDASSIHNNGKFRSTESLS